MAEYWRRPFGVQAVRWFPQLGILRGMESYGCYLCYPEPCASGAHHAQGPRPHHLLLRTLRGITTVFAGDWVVTYQDGQQWRLTDEEFAAQYMPALEYDEYEHYLSYRRYVTEAATAAPLPGADEPAALPSSMKASG
jgi:hypothetical protein